MAVFVAFTLGRFTYPSLGASVALVAAERVLRDVFGPLSLEVLLDMDEQYYHNNCCTYLRHRIFGITSDLLLVMRMNLSVTKKVT